MCVTHLRSIRTGNWSSILFEEDQPEQEVNNFRKVNTFENKFCRFQIVSNMEDDCEERSDENGNDFIDQVSIRSMR